MFGLESVGPGRDVRVEGAGVPEFETPLGAPAAELAAQAWLGQVDEPRDDKLSELRTWVDGLPGKLRDSFLGEAVAGFEEVSNGIRDGLVQGFADAIRDVENLGSRLIPVRDAARALIRPVEAKVTDVEVQQLEAAEKLTELEAARGYVQAYQSLNREHPGGGGTSKLTYAAMGYQHGGFVTSSGIALTSHGIWTVHFQAFGADTSSLTGLGVKDEVTAELYVEIVSSEGIVLRTFKKEIAKPGGTGKVSLETSFPIIIPEGHTVVIQPSVYSARRRRFLGGDRYSVLCAVKRDTATGPQGEETVPDA